MSKIKLNLTSGVSVEKPLMNAFIANNNNYVILDNEINGSMGLPIILVCKLVDNKLIKITDQNEWTQVKEYLKQIIAGNKLESINISNQLSADDVYYTQLTLPIPSFEALKNAYQVEVPNAIEKQASVTPEMANPTPPVEPVAVEPTVAPVMPSAPVTPTEPEAVVPMMGNVGIEPVSPVPSAPIAPEIPEVNMGPSINVNNPSTQAVNPAPAFNPISASEPVVPTPVSAPVMPDVTPSVPEVNNTPLSNGMMPAFEMPSVPTEPQANQEMNMTPVMGNENIQMPASPVMSEIPVVEAPSEVVSEEETGLASKITENTFASQKEAFLEACENMFDALVQKFEKELENKN